LFLKFTIPYIFFIYLELQGSLLESLCVCVYAIVGFINISSSFFSVPVMSHDQIEAYQYCLGLTKKVVMCTTTIVFLFFFKQWNMLLVWRKYYLSVIFQLNWQCRYIRCMSLKGKLKKYISIKMKNINVLNFFCYNINYLFKCTHNYLNTKINRN
jgi:hypothetical protein